MNAVSCANIPLAMKLAKRNSRKRITEVKPPSPAEPIRLDLGCGPGKRKTDAQGQPQTWIGVDSIAFPGVDVVLNLAEPIYSPFPTWKDPNIAILEGYERKPMGYVRWPWADNSVEEAHASHFIEHLEPMERWHFFNELYRVLKPGAKATIITPDWCSQRAYGDMTHKWPPVSGFFWFYLSKEWRAANAPHNDAQHVKGGLSCNFGAQWGPTVHPEIATRNQEYQQHAITFFKEACQDSICTLTKA
jgi:SAM-dependent methyltransferase